MKLHKVFYSVLICMLFGWIACSDMNDLHIGYLEEGEAIYAAKVDSISAGPGKERIEMEVFVQSQRIEFVRFYWNSYHDSLDFQLGNQTGIFKVMIENLPEREYLFQAVSFDKFGNKSLPYEIAGISYGENYRKVLPNRRIESIRKQNNGDVVFTWSGVTEEAVSTTLTYLSDEGESQVKVIPATVSKDTIADYRAGSEFSYYTSYKPTVNSPDVFNTDKSTDNFPE